MNSGKTASGFRLAATLGVALTVLTVAVFGQALGFGFVHYDDPDMILENPHVLSGLTIEGAGWAFTTGYFYNWHPLTWLSHMVDCTFFGARAGGHHLTSVALHVLNVLLLFGVLYRITGALWRSAFVAALFAVHPLHVEPVVWISDRKDVLAACFGFSTLLAYAAYVRRPGPAHYTIALVLFALGILSKSMLVTWPFLLLLLDYWPLRRSLERGGYDTALDEGEVGVDAQPKRRHSRRVPGSVLFVEKLPFFTIALGAALAAMRLKTPQMYPLHVRAANAVVAYATYVVKMFWPARLGVLYPHPGDTLPGWQVAGVAALLAIVTAAVVATRRKRPHLLVGWLWYVVTLSPACGLVQIGDHAIADRYTYIPLVGLFIMASWGLGDAAQSSRAAKTACSAVALAAIGACAACAYVQTAYWRDDFALFGRTLEVTENNRIAHYNLGRALAESGRLDEAVAHFTEAVRIDPKYADAHYNMGLAYFQQGRFRAALPCFEKAAQLEPDVADVHNNLGAALVELGRVAEARAELEKAVQLAPDAPDIRYNFARILANQGDFAAAITHYEAALEADPDNVEIRRELNRARLAAPFARRSP